MCCASYSTCNYCQSCGKLPLDICPWGVFCDMREDVSTIKRGKLFIFLIAYSTMWCVVSLGIKKKNVF